MGKTFNSRYTKRKEHMQRQWKGNKHLFLLYTPTHTHSHEDTEHAYTLIRKTIPKHGTT
jgi:hypothetical protein